MPAFFVLARHDALVQADGNLLPSEHIFAFLDDLYITTTASRAAEATSTVTTPVERHAGVRSHLGKLRMWSTTNKPAPQEVIDSFGLDVWCNAKSAAENGIKILGTPMGTQEFVDAFIGDKIIKENRC